MPSRRAILKGLGATVALPWLESWSWAQQKRAGERSLDKPPLRWGCVLFANGVNPQQWWAKNHGNTIELSPTLKPLTAFRKDILFLKELHVFNNTSGPHWPLFTNYLNGAPVRQGLIPEGSISIDQLIAKHTGKETAVPSLVLGVEPAESGLRGGVPSVYYGTVSWTSRNTPVPPEIYPRAAFDRLFDTTAHLRDQSVLDTVLDQTKQVNGRLGKADRQKLDEFFGSVRDLEQRIERATREERLECWRPSLTKPNIPRPADKPPQDVREHMKMMIDLIVLAWQMDRTRVATLILNRDVSHMQFGFLDGVGNEQLHSISHHKNKPATLDQYSRINRFHVEQFAYLLGRMKAIDEGDGSSLLDNSMVTFGSNMMDGDTHDGRDLPLLLAGHAGGSIKTGRVLDYTSRPEEEQRLCNLHLSAAKLMGVKVDQFGDSVHPLKNLV